MAYAILRTIKLKSWGSIGGSVAHTDRLGSQGPNADPARRALNRVLVGKPGESVDELRARVGQVTTNPRANAVLAVEVFLGMSSEWMVGKSEKELAAWTRSNLAWLRETFGEKNVVSATLHRDETTPHIVAYVVPEIGGKLNARALLGGREKLVAMQTDYATAMAPHGLERGLEGSKAEHVPVKKFYAQLNRIADEAEKRIAELGDPSPPPNFPFLTRQEVRTAATAAWTDQERSRTIELVLQASGAFLDASIARNQVEHLREENSRLSTDLGETRVRLSEVYEQLGLSKDQVGALRRADVSMVAQRLGHMGEVRPKENAIDLVKRIGGFDYGQAVAWLHSEFGPVVAGAVVTASLQASPPDRPLTKAENVICQKVAKQTDALGCDKYRVTLLPSDETKKPYLPGKSKGKQSEERFYTRNELLQIVPWLRTRNNLGDNVLITPMDDSAHYILLDDARVSAEELERRGFQPCLVQQTSWQSQQVVFKVPKDLDREVVIGLFNDLNQKWGDVEMTGLRHPFRMAGFRNMKPKHEREGQRPFVELLQAVNRFCTKCTALIRQRTPPSLAASPEAGPAPSRRVR